MKSEHGWKFSPHIDTLLTIAMLLVMFLQPAYSQVEEQDKPIVVAVSERIGTLDSSYAYGWDNFFISSALGAGLLRWDNLAQKPELDLAKSITISDDGLAFDVELHDDIYFQNGRQIVASDIIFSYERNVSVKTKSPFTAMFSSIKGYKAMRSEHTEHLSGLIETGTLSLRIELSRPDVTLLTVLSFPFGFIVPKEEVIREDFARYPIGAGPYKVIENTRTQVVLEKNPFYKNSKPHSSKKIILQPDVSFSKAIRDLQRNRVHYAHVFNTTRNMSLLLKDPAYTKYLRSIKDNSVIYVTMNTEFGPLRDVRLRKALNYAVDKEKLLRKHLAHAGVVAHHILPAGLRPSLNKPANYSYSIKEAKKILADVDNVDNIHLTFVVGENTTNIDVAQSIVEDLKNIGISVTLEIVPNDEFINRTKQQKNTDMILSDGFAWIADYPDPSNFFYPLFTKDSIDNGFNWARYVNKEMEERANEISAIYDDSRLQHWDKLFEDIQLQDAPWIPLYHRNLHLLFSDKLQKSWDAFTHGEMPVYYMLENLYFSETEK